MSFPEDLSYIFLLPSDKKFKVIKDNMWAGMGCLLEGGYIKDNKMYGKVRIMYDDMYVSAEFSENKMNGKGTMLGTNMEATGIFKNNKLHGQGTIKLQNIPEVCIGRPKQTYRSGLFVEGIFTGEGYIVYSYEDKTVNLHGTFKNGKLDGKGQIRYTYQSIIHFTLMGTFSDGKLVGIGELIYHDDKRQKHTEKFTHENINDDNCKFSWNDTYGTYIYKKE